MTRTASIFRWVTFLAAIPFLYFVITNEPHNWLYYLSLSLILAAYVAQTFYFWKMGDKAKLRQRLVLLAIVIIAIALLAFLK